PAPARPLLGGRGAVQVERSRPRRADGPRGRAVRGEVNRGARLALSLLAVLSAAPASAATPCPDCLEAGAARVALRLPAGLPPAGYGALARRLTIPDVLGRYPHAFWLKPSTGERDPLAVRALVLQTAGRRLAWVALDLLAVDAAFTAEVEQA